MMEAGLFCSSAAILRRYCSVLMRWARRKRLGQGWLRSSNLQLGTPADESIPCSFAKHTTHLYVRSIDVLADQDSRHEQKRWKTTKRPSRRRGSDCVYWTLLFLSSKRANTIPISGASESTPVFCKAATRGASHISYHLIPISSKSRPSVFHCPSQSRAHPPSHTPASYILPGHDDYAPTPPTITF